MGTLRAKAVEVAMALTDCARKEDEAEQVEDEGEGPEHDKEVEDGTEAGGVEDKD